MLVGTLSAQAAFVPSADTYGIINIPISIGMNAVGISLLPMEAGTNRIHDVILPAGLKTGDKISGDELSVWNIATQDYTAYYLAAGNVWTNTTASPQAVLGQGVWIDAEAATTIYQVGILKTNAYTDVTCAAIGYTFVANPYPSILDLDGVGTSLIDWSYCAAGGTGLSKNALTGDLLRIWTGTKYDTYYFFNNGTAGIAGWYSTDNKGRRPPELPPGKGFFFQRKTSNANPMRVSKSL